MYEPDINPIVEFIAWAETVKPPLRSDWCWRESMFDSDKSLTV